MLIRFMFLRPVSTFFHGYLYVYSIQMQFLYFVKEKIFYFISNSKQPEKEKFGSC